MGVQAGKFVTHLRETAHSINVKTRNVCSMRPISAVWETLEGEAPFR
jgi:hypothetical protein